MKPISFPEANVMMKGRPDDDVGDLPTCADGEVFVSVWQPSEAEIEEIIRTKAVYFVLWGSKHPPVYLTGHRANVFPEPEIG